MRDAQLMILSEIVSGVAHDMGTPLNVISGYSESIAMSVPEDSPIGRNVSKVVEQTRRVAGMIRQMLDVVRIAAGDAAGGRSLDTFTRDIHQIAGHMFRQRKVRSEFEASGRNDAITGEMPVLAQALYGVFRSAAVAIGPKGQCTVRAVSTGSPGGGVAIEGVVAGGAAANLAALAERGLGFREGAYAGLALAEVVFGKRGGGLEPLRGEDGAAGLGLFVRFGAPGSQEHGVRTEDEAGD